MGILYRLHYYIFGKAVPGVIKLIKWEEEEKEREERSEFKRWWREEGKKLE